MMHSISLADRDPFPSTTDAAAYIPRTATESVLVRLEMALRDGARVVCLDGPAGSGKTLLLRVLEERLAGDFTSLRVPYPNLEPDEFFQWALASLRESSADPERALAERIVRDAVSGEQPLVWIIDDAQSLPAATLDRLLGLQRVTGDALRLLLASAGALPTDPFAQAGVLPVRVELEGEMESDEMQQYVRARLERAGADPAQCARVEASFDRLYAGSGGNPGRLHAAASVLLCFGPERLAALERELADAQQRSVEPSESREPDVAEVEVAAVEHASIESIVAEAVAAEPLEEIASPEPAPEPELESAAPHDEAPVPSPTPPDLPPSTPRKRLRLRRRGRR
jgi:type II secretory pathway predicted ATPase ExeA